MTTNKTNAKTAKTAKAARVPAKLKGFDAYAVFGTRAIATSLAALALVQAGSAIANGADPVKAAVTNDGLNKATKGHNPSGFYRNPDKLCGGKDYAAGPGPLYKTGWDVKTVAVKAVDGSARTIKARYAVPRTAAAKRHAVDLFGWPVPQRKLKTAAPDKGPKPTAKAQQDDKQD